MNKNNGDNKTGLESEQSQTHSGDPSPGRRDEGPTVPSRRELLKTSVAASAFYWLGPKLMLGGRVVGDAAAAAFSTPTLNLARVPKFVTPLLIPPVMPKAGAILLKNGKNADYYEISIRQIVQQILPPKDVNNNPLGATTVWGYGAVKSSDKSGLLLHNAPSLTIETDWNRPVRIKWINELVDASGNYLPHLLPVDPTLHWANPPGGATGRDMRPTFTSTPGRYTGPAPMVTHVHGAIGVGDESDGYAEAWYLPNARNIPAGYATVGTWNGFFANKANQKFGVT